MDDKSFYPKKLKDLPAEERPQERLEKLGAAALSDRELLAILIRSGTSSCDVLEIADDLIRKAGSLAGAPQVGQVRFPKDQWCWKGKGFATCSSGRGFKAYDERSKNSWRTTE